MKSGISAHGCIRRGAIAARTSIFLAVVSAPLLWMGYVFLNESLTGGIQQHADYAEVDLKALGYFPFNERNGSQLDVPARYRELDGKRVVLTGYMSATNSSASRISSFQFVYNRSICCNGGPPQVQERVFVTAANGDVPYTDDLVKIQGVLHVNVTKAGGIVTSVYTLDLERVDPL